MERPHPTRNPSVWEISGEKGVYRDQSGGTTNRMVRRRYDERRRHPISNSVTSALPVILQSAPDAKCDLGDIRERRVRIRCKMQQKFGGPTSGHH